MKSCRFVPFPVVAVPCHRWILLATGRARFPVDLPRLRWNCVDSCRHPHLRLFVRPFHRWQCNAFSAHPVNHNFSVLWFLKISLIAFKTSYLRSNLGISSIIAEIVTLGLSRLPLVVSIVLIAVGISSCGALAIVLGLFFCIWKVINVVSGFFSIISTRFLIDVRLLRRPVGIAVEPARKTRSRW